MKLNLSIFYCLALFKLLPAQTLKLDGWHIDTLPKNTSSLLPVIYSDRWFFFSDSSEIRPKKLANNNTFSPDYLKDNQFNNNKDVSVNVLGGKLFIQNRFQLGSSLLYKSFDGKKSYELFMLSGVSWLFKYKNNIMCVESVGHLGSKYGKLLSINYHKKWETKLLYDFKETPLLFYPYNNNLFVVCNNTIGYFDSNYVFYTIIKLPISIDILGPTSMHIQDNEIYVAMAGGILKISDSAENSKLYWLTQK